MRLPPFSRLIVLTCLLLHSGTSSAQQSSIDNDIRLLIKTFGLTGNPAAGVTIPSINAPKSQLGMKLFYSRSLGGDETTACVTCHHPVLGGGDQLSLPIGVDSVRPEILGPNRRIKANHKVKVPRNAPTTFNIALWKKHMFHDGRIKKLDAYSIQTPDVGEGKADALGGENLVQAQARFPTTSNEEMRGTFMSAAMSQTVRRSLANRLKKNWENDFREAFNDRSSPIDDLITEQNISEAIADYERSQLFVKNPWSEYVAGNNQAISDQAKRGAALFFKTQDQGGAGCASCHSGDFFTNEEFYNTAMPQIGEGKPKHDADKDKDDMGCFLVTAKEDDRYRFRTPSLLNVEVTGPWGHAGAYTSLEAVTRHMLNPKQAVRNYDLSQVTQPDIDIDKARINTAKALKSGIDITPMPNSTEQDVEDLVAFMKTLTDPCVKSRECLSPWIPDQNSNDPDGNMLHGLRQAGQRL
ncbi:cytochrome-c peroxidase [Leucothrix pacifica]|uniref:Cytochrome-c peroxidase n=1 Tax=Leucothrix pacifica TaxID=1247513 RepID=A0A317C8G3_9GAMM|nr:cytochrome c peroxidase [Leucothrix pacifica]PWQ92422.1 cytochrome-c peroxidase [Leucothrix pacifica]